ncbi:TetR/AcrR family transcriptional regulator [Kribbella sp. NPDC051586]|uniref:TetR/AcrR family transcriptional regulator n=1 Tax=Kribbella sp. NPDC051586 TaxID=3364118 RepID=UPI0037AB0120
MVAVTPPARRRRGSELERAVFDATLRELADVGLAALTMDRIAALAHTGKAALYRRWTDKSDLVLDALRSALPSPAEIEPTGDLRGELLALLVCVQQASTVAHSNAFRAAALAGNRDCRQLLEDRVLRPCREGIKDALSRAAERDEVSGSLASDPLVAAVGPAMLVDRVLTGDGRLADEFVVDVVDRLLLPLVTAGKVPTSRSRRS